MAVTAAQIQRLIILRIGDTGDGVLAANIAAIWDSYADKAALYPRLQELYTQREGIDLVMAAARGQVDFGSALELTVKASQEFAHLVTMRATLDTQIAELERQARANRRGVVAPLVTVAPESPPTGPEPFGPLDANDSRYAGSVYKRIVGSRGGYGTPD